MKRHLPLIGCALLAFCRPAVAELDIDPARIDAYITPYYINQGPVIAVGRFSAGLAAKDEKSFVTTIAQMKESWQQLSFPELYVAAIRLYDLGYRKESVYWFYTAQYRGRQFATLAADPNAGSIGDPAFELFHAQDAFFGLVGPYINGYAFGDPDGLIKVIERVREEGRKIPDMKAIYSGVKFKSTNEWEAKNTELADGMGKLIDHIRQQKADIKRLRAEQGIEAMFEKLDNRELTSR